MVIYIFSKSRAGIQHVNREPAASFTLNRGPGASFTDMGGGGVEEGCIADIQKHRKMLFCCTIEKLAALFPVKCLV